MLWSPHSKGLTGIGVSYDNGAKHMSIKISPHNAANGFRPGLKKRRTLPRSPVAVELNMLQGNHGSVLNAGMSSKFANRTYTLITSVHNGKTNGAQPKCPMLRSRKSASA